MKGTKKVLRLCLDYGFGRDKKKTKENADGQNGSDLMI